MLFSSVLLITVVASSERSGAVLRALEMQQLRMRRRPSLSPSSVNSQSTSSDIVLVRVIVNADSTGGSRTLRARLVGDWL